MSKKSVSTTTAGPGFEPAMAELEQLVAQMEAGSLPLEASLASYQRGSELVKYCNAQLERVEQQVRLLEEDMLKPFNLDAEPTAPAGAAA